MFKCISWQQCQDCKQMLHKKHFRVIKVKRKYGLYLHRYQRCWSCENLRTKDQRAYYRKKCRKRDLQKARDQSRISTYKTRQNRIANNQCQRCGITIIGASLCISCYVDARVRRFKLKYPTAAISRSYLLDTMPRHNPYPNVQLRLHMKDHGRIEATWTKPLHASFGKRKEITYCTYS